MDKLQNTDNTECWQGCRGMGALTQLLVGMPNSTATLEHSVAVLTTTKHLYRRSTAALLRYSPKGVETLCPDKNPHLDVCSRFIRNCQN